MCIRDRLYGGKHGGHLGVIASLVGEVMGVKRAAITCDISGNKKTLKVEGAGEWDMDAVEDGNGNVAKCEYHPLAINPGFPVEVNKTNKQAFTDYGQNWSPKPDRVGLSGPFSYAP